MSVTPLPPLQGIVDTEQTVTRYMNFGIEVGDDRFDFEVSHRSGTFRPLGAKFHYRVNRGSTAPYWYLFQVTIRGARVLRGGRISTAGRNIIAHSSYIERTPQWAREMGRSMQPLVEVEHRCPGV